MRRAGPLLLCSILTANAALAFAAGPALADTASPSGAAASSSAAPSSGSNATVAPLITRGQQQFDDQQYEESLQTLSAALVRPGSTTPQRIEIYRLIAYNYITLDRRDEAEGACRGLFAIAPDYSLPDRESPRFRDFFTAAKKRWEQDGRPGLVKGPEAPVAPVTMRHASPSQADAGTDISLTAHLDDPQHRITQVKLFYRTGSKGVFAATNASSDGDTVRATIPRVAVKPPLVEYYLLGVDSAGLAIASRGDAAAPLRVAIPDSSKGWILPVAIGGSVLGAGAVVGILALAGVFKGSSHTNGSPTSTVMISVGNSWHHF